MTLLFLYILLATALTIAVRVKPKKNGERSVKRFRGRVRAPALPCEPARAHSRDARLKPEWVGDALSTMVSAVPDISCRNLKLQFDLAHRETGVSIGKTYAAEFLKRYRKALAAPKRHAHSIDSAERLLTVWALDLTEARLAPERPQLVLGLLDHASRQVLALKALRDKKTITILRVLLDAIEYHGTPKAIRTDNEAIFTSWVFAFALRWLGIRHQRTLPHCPWMNGRIERFWRTLKEALKLFDIADEAELQATLEMLKQNYNQHRPHQSLSGLTPNQAAQVLRRRARKKPPRRP